MRAAAVFVFAALVAAAAAAAVDVRGANEDMASALGWGRIGRAPAAQLKTVYVALSHSADTRAALLATLERVSDPQSPQYGRCVQLHSKGGWRGCFSLLFQFFFGYLFGGQLTRAPPTAT